MKNNELVAEGSIEEGLVRCPSQVLAPSSRIVERTARSAMQLEIPDIESVVNEQAFNKNNVVLKAKKKSLARVGSPITSDPRQLHLVLAKVLTQLRVAA